MGFFDFLKRKELEKIKYLENRVKDLENQNNYLSKSLAKYSPLIDLDSEVQKIQESISKIERDKISVLNQYEQLKNQYQTALITYEELKKKISIFEDDLEMAEYGVYQPHFSFDTSEEYKQKILFYRNEAKAMIKEDSAVNGGHSITWNGSLSKGQAMVKKEKQLMLRAFNGETDSFIANVDWNNILKMEERLNKSFEAINKVYKEQGLAISEAYKSYKVWELQLTYEYKKKLQEEREEQRAIREQMREEERAEKELEAARIKAEKEEIMYIKALEKARKEVGTAVGKKQEELLQRIAELEAGLVGVETLKQKAISMAQQTKMGYVYVISNIGAFGDDVYKIGMTRRLEPTDRVKELGDASVPFPFDIHAMIFSENAPELETKLHNIFVDNRVNMTNYKREFFNISLERIEEEAKKLGAKVEFTKLAEAKEYRETQALRKQLSHPIKDEKTEFPKNI